MSLMFIRARDEHYVETMEHLSDISTPNNLQRAMIQTSALNRYSVMFIITKVGGYAWKHLSVI